MVIIVIVLRVNPYSPLVWKVLKIPLKLLVRLLDLILSIFNVMLLHNFQFTIPNY